MVPPLCCLRGGWGREGNGLLEPSAAAAAGSDAAAAADVDSPDAAGADATGATAAGANATGATAVGANAAGAELAAVGRAGAAGSDAAASAASDMDDHDGAAGAPTAAPDDAASGAGTIATAGDVDLTGTARSAGHVRNVDDSEPAQPAQPAQPVASDDDPSAPKHILQAANALREAVGPTHRFRIRLDDGVCSVQCMLQECIDKGVAQCVKCGVEGRALINFSKDHLGYQKRSGIQIEKMANVHRKAVGLASADSASAAGTVGADVDDDVTQMTAESAATVKATRAGSDKERRSSVLGDVELRTSAPPADADERSEGATSRAASSGESGVDHFRQSQRAQEPWTVDYEVRTHNGAPWLFCLVCSMPKIRCETAPYRVESGAKQHRGITGLSEGCVRKSVPRSERDITSFIQKRV